MGKKKWMAGLSKYIRFELPVSKALNYIKHRK